MATENGALTAVKIAPTVLMEHSVILWMDTVPQGVKQVGLTQNVTQVCFYFFRKLIAIDLCFSKI